MRIKELNKVAAVIIGSVLAANGQASEKNVTRTVASDDVSLSVICTVNAVISGGTPQLLTHVSDPSFGTPEMNQDGIVGAVYLSKTETVTRDKALDIKSDFSSFDGFNAVEKDPKGIVKYLMSLKRKAVAAGKWSSSGISFHAELKQSNDGSLMLSYSENNGVGAGGGSFMLGSYISPSETPFLAAYGNDDITSGAQFSLFGIDYIPYLNVVTKISCK